MDREAWRVIVHGVTKSQTRLCDSRRRLLTTACRVFYREKVLEKGLKKLQRFRGKNIFFSDKCYKPSGDFLFKPE